MGTRWNASLPTLDDVNKLQRHTRQQHPLWQLTLMRWRIFVREPSALFWTYGFPVVLALALGVAFRNRPPEPVEVAIEAAPGCQAWRETLATNSQVHVRWLNPLEAREALRVGKVSVVVGCQDAPLPFRRGEGRGEGSVSSPGFVGSRKSSELPRIYQFDPTRPESRMARAVVDDALQRGEGRTDPTPVRDQLVTEVGSRYIDFLIPGLLGFNLMSSGLWGVGFVIVEMRVRKLIKRMMATPMSRAHFLLGELPVLLGFAHWVFHVPIRGSLLLIVGLSALGSLMFAGMGLLIGSRAQNTHTVAGLGADLVHSRPANVSLAVICRAMPCSSGDGNRNESIKSRNQCDDRSQAPCFIPPCHASYQPRATPWVYGHEVNVAG